MIRKTNAARFLDNKKIEYELVGYEVDENDLSAINVASKCGIKIAKVYKTIVCECEPKGFVTACIQGNLSLNLKALARISGHKRCELLNLKELEKVTGYIRGGCSPIAMKKNFDTFFDRRVLEQDFIYVSAGIRGMQIKIEPLRLIEVIGAKIGDLV